MGGGRGNEGVEGLLLSVGVLVFLYEHMCEVGGMDWWARVAVEEATH